MKKLLLIIAVAFCVSTKAQFGLDVTFGTNGAVSSSIGSNLLTSATDNIIQSDGKIIVVGDTFASSANNYDFAVMRYNVDGTLDSTFGTAGKVFTTISTGADRARSVALQADGKIVVGGSAVGTLADFALVRYNTNGTLDTTFGTTGIVMTNNYVDEIYGIAIQPDGKIITAGSVAPFGQNARWAVCRYNSNGILDTTFATNGMFIQNITPNSGASIASRIGIQTDGKIVVSGNGYTNNTQGLNIYVARFNSNGTLDTTFGTSGVFNYSLTNSTDNVNTLKIQNDGKIVLGGDFYIQKYRPFVMRLNSTGTLDTTFNGAYQGYNQLFFGGGTTTGNDSLQDLYINSIGEIVAVGHTTYQNASISKLFVAKFNSNGTTQTTFGNNTEGQYIVPLPTTSTYLATCLSIQTDEKIIVSGTSSTSSDSFLTLRFTDSTLSSETFHSNNLKASIYPNPAKDILNIEMENEVKSVEIYSLQGQKVLTSNAKNVNVSGLSKGMYLVRIEDENNAVATQKLIIK
jgi:uncharacterized delta-60 repeat protein